MASYFPQAGNLNNSNADMCSDVAGPSIAWATCLSFQIDHRSRTFTISPTTSTTGRHLGFKRDFNYHTAFRACFVIMHKVYSLDFISGVFFIVLTDFLFSALNIFNTGIMKGCCVQLASKLLIAFHNELTALDKLVIRSFRTYQSFTRSFL